MNFVKQLNWFYIKFYKHRTSCNTHPMPSGRRLAVAAGWINIRWTDGGCVAISRTRTKGLRAACRYFTQPFTLLLLLEHIVWHYRALVGVGTLWRCIAIVTTSLCLRRTVNRWDEKGFTTTSQFLPMVAGWVVGEEFNNRNGYKITWKCYIKR